MSVSFRVSELAALYGLNADTLRYYEEQGLLHPRRGENRYRAYSIADLCDLNIIRSLRELDVGVEEIRGYLTHRTASGTAEMLASQRAIIQGRIDALLEKRRAVEERQARLQQAMARPVGQAALTTLPRRPCIRLRKQGIPEADVDYLLKQLEREHQGVLKELGVRQMGAVMDSAALAAGRCDRYEAVFFLCAEDGDTGDALPAGDYLTYVHAGPYDSIGESYRALYEAAASLGRAPADTPVELYLVDVHDTALEAEFRTELQMRLLP